MHKLVVRVQQIREVVSDLTEVGFSPQQAKSLILMVKKIHDGPWPSDMEEQRGDRESDGRDVDR